MWIEANQEDSSIQVNQGNKWLDCTIKLWFSSTNATSEEWGAYTTWFSDPSENVMVHFIVDTSVKDNIAEYREIGTVEWKEVSEYSEKKFPYTQYSVKWFKLQELRPATQYEIKLKQSSQAHLFKTMPKTMNNDVQLAMISDQIDSLENYKTEGVEGLTTIFDTRTDVIVIAGDAVHDNGTKQHHWEAFWAAYFQVSAKYNIMIPIVVALGNHDGRVNDSTGSFKSLLWESRGATKDNVAFHYYFFSNLTDEGYGVIDIGDYMSLVTLNSGHTSEVEGEQTEWLSRTLQDRSEKIVFPFMHVSPYPGHYDYNNAISKNIREKWTPLFSRYGVKVAGSGHEHVHLITKPVVNAEVDTEKGIVFTGQGHGMGNLTRSSIIPQNTWYVEYLNNKVRGFDLIQFKKSKDVVINKVTLSGETMFIRRVVK